MRWTLLLIDFVDGTDTMSSPETRFERLADLPPSAKLVYRVLATEGPLTQSKLVEETFLVKRTVRKALTELETADLIEVQAYNLDARKKLYHPRPVTRPE